MGDAAYEAWLQAQLESLRGVVAQELTLLDTRLPDLHPDDRAVVDQVIERVVDRLAHQPLHRPLHTSQPDRATLQRQAIALWGGPPGPVVAASHRSYVAGSAAMPNPPDSHAAPAQWSEVRADHKSRSRDHIGETALDLAAQRGIEAVTMRDLATASGVSRPTLYSYFPSVRAAIDHVITQVAHRHRSDLSALVQQPGTAVDRVRAFCETHAAFVAGSRHAALIAAVRLAGLGDQPAGEGHQGFVVGILADLLRQGTADDFAPEVRRDPSGAAALIVSLLAGAVEDSEASGNRRRLAVQLALRALGAGTS